MVKRRATPAPPTEPPRRTPTQVPRAPAPRPTYRPIDFEGEDTSLTQDQLAVLK